MGRGNRSHKVAPQGGRQTSLDGTRTASSSQSSAPLPDHPKPAQAPYEERLLRWFSQREETLKKRK